MKHETTEEKEEKYQPAAMMPCRPFPVYQTSHNQHCTIQRGAINLLPEGTLSMALTSTQAPEPPSATVQYYGPVQLQYENTQNVVSIAMTSTQAAQRLPCTFQKYERELYDQGMQSNPTLQGSAGDMSTCQQCYPGSSLQQTTTETSNPSSQKPVKDSSQKREIRLMKNREAARQCRRKKKEYIRCLENRVDTLESKNQALIEELRALKDICRLKAK